MYHFKNKTDERYFEIDKTDSEKYVVICVAKNENDYIREWVWYHLSIGFDKIIIGDNNDDDSLKEVLSDYIECGMVSLYDCNGLSNFQDPFYTMFSTVGNYKWAAYIDCDEFIEIPLYRNIKDYLDSIDDDCVCFNWITMSNENAIIREEGDVTERFKTPLLPLNFIKYNFNVKSIIRGGKSFVFTDPHVARPNQDGLKYNYYGTRPGGEYHGMFVDDVDYRVGYVKHYTTKSFAECMEKVNRGYPDGGKINRAEMIWKACNPTKTPSLEEYIAIDINLCPYIIERFRKDIEECNYIKIKTLDIGSSFGVLRNVLGILASFSGKTLIFDRNFPSLLYTIILGYTIGTTNRVLTVTDNFEDYRRATDNLKPNFIITFQEMN